MLMQSLACATLSGVKPTPTPDYLFEPVTTPLTFTPASLPNGQTGMDYKTEIFVSGNVTPLSSVFLSKGTLPTGLELVFTSGGDSLQISGVPQKAGTYTFTVFVSCFGTMVNGQTADKEYIIVVE